MSIAYEGKEPYIFVSYAHRDNGIVLPIIRRLQREGFRVWYDEGIEAGSEWPDYIASHLKCSFCVISMVSNNFADSLYCRQELTYAQKYRKEMLSVYLEDGILPDGLELQLASNQGMYRNRFASAELFMEKLCSARILQPCRIPANEAPEEKEPDGIEIPEYRDIYEEMEYEPPVHSPTRELLDRLKITVPDDEYEDDEEDPVVPPEAPTEEEQYPRSKGRNRFLGRTAACLEFLYIFIAPWLTKTATSSYSGVGNLIFRMAWPHTALALAVALLLYVTRRKTNSEERGTVVFINMMIGLFASVAAVIVSVSSVQIPVSLFLRILISLGLNILPTLLIEGIYLLCMGLDMKRDEEYDDDDFDDFDF